MTSIRVFVLTSLVAPACVVDRDAGSLTSSGASDTTSSADSTSGAADDVDSVDTGDRLDLGTTDVGTEVCESIEASSMIVEGPSDILIVVDQAISHEQHEATFQNFSLLIGNDQIEDVRVVMIAGYPADGGGVCIDEPPLGIGQCPVTDDNPPMYRHVPEPIETATLFSQVLDRHDAWGPAMREDAWKHVWIVSSDDPATDTDDFVAGLLALDPAFARLTVHAFVPDDTQVGDCLSVVPNDAWAPALELRDLALATGGVFEPLCNYNLKILFTELLDRIQAVALACSYDIPPPPGDQVFDKGRVNVDYDDGFGLRTIGWVESVADCPTVPDGWYYDDPVTPTSIEMCPQTCSRFAALAQASIEIRFGCTTIPAG
jgi:hypothetical protein